MYIKGHRISNEEGNEEEGDYYILIPDNKGTIKLTDDPINTHIKIKGFKIATGVINASFAWVCNTESGARIMALLADRSYSYLERWKSVKMREVAIWAALTINFIEKNGRK